MNLKVVLALSATLTFWASAFVGIRAALPFFEPGHLAFLRFLFASASMLIYATWAKIRLPRLRDMPAILFHGFLGYTVYHVALNYGETTVSAGSASFIISSIPVFSTLFAVILLGEKIVLRTVLGICISMLGIALIAFGEGGGLSFDTGALLVLLAAFSESLYIVLQKSYLERYTPFEYVTYTILAGTFFMGWYMPGLPDAVAAAPLEAIIAVAYLGICPGAVAYAFWSYALSKGDVSKIVVTQYSLPAITLVLGFIWLGEFPAPLALSGGLVAIVGVVVITAPARLFRRLQKQR